MQTTYDSLMLVSFGGPEGKGDVMPFLERVTHGKRVPRSRLEEVAEHYYHFDGVSPINAQNRELIAALKESLAAQGVTLPIYFGNRNWHPFLSDTLKSMTEKGHRKTLAIFTSMFSSYSGCRQYRENIALARDEVGANAPTVDKVRFGFNHPGFIDAMAARVLMAAGELSSASPDDTELIFTAHSIPESMARGCAYERQLNEAAGLVTKAVGWNAYTFAWQSRSGGPGVPWLEPDIVSVISTLHERGVKKIIVAPLGFISDHIEVLFDLDIEAKEHAQKLGVEMARAGTVGCHPRFIEMLTELVIERLEGKTDRVAIGALSAWHDVCPQDCCPSGMVAAPAACQTAQSST